MRIAVINLPSTSGGGLTILNSLYDYATTVRGKSHEWLFVVSTQPLNETANIRIAHFPHTLKCYFNRLLAEIWGIPRIVSEFAADVVVSMQSVKLLGLSCPQAVYMQQSLPFQKVYRFSFWKKGEFDYAIRQYAFGAMIKHSVKTAAVTFVQTQWICDAVKEATGIDRVVNIGYPQLSPSLINNSRMSVGSDFFFPAGYAVYKNYALLNKVALRLRKKGYTGFRIYLTITREEFIAAIPRQQPIDEVFCYMGKIPFSEVLKRYDKCIMIFPSYIETLGLPLVEAKGRGCYIIASDCPFSHEVLDEYSNVKFFNPFSEDELLHEMELVLQNNICYKPIQNNQANRQKNCWEGMLCELEGIVLKP